MSECCKYLCKVYEKRTMRRRSLFLIRHGETQWNHDGNKYLGRTDIDLNEQGIKQAQRLGAALALRLSGAISIPESVYLISSTLKRAKHTADIITESFPVLPHPIELKRKEHDHLREVDFGTWEGRTRGELLTADTVYTQWLINPEGTTIPGGENLGKAADRALEAFNQVIRESLHNTSKDEVIILVAHNTLNRVLITRLLGMPLSKYRSIVQSNCGLTTFEITDNGVTLVSMNETAFLEDM